MIAARWSGSTLATPNSERLEATASANEPAPFSSSVSNLAGALLNSPSSARDCGAQTMMATANFYRLEIAYSELDQYNRALTPPLDVRGGYFYVSDRPGLGHDLRQDYVAQAVAF